MATNPAKVLLSSTCISTSNFANLCKYLLDNDINQIELSGNLRHIPDVECLQVFEAYQNQIQFYIHNYFPAPKTPFVLNLAHRSTVKQSIRHCKKAIDICSLLRINCYSLHAGFAINPNPKDLGKSQTHLDMIDINESRKILFDACIEVAEYGQKNNVKLLLENNVVAQFNCPNNINQSYHLSDLTESKYLLSLFEHHNIGVLLDTGHLKVSAQTLNYHPVKFIDRFRNYIKVVQISENDGISDQNLPVKSNSWFWPHIPWSQLEYVSLEVVRQPLEILFDQIKLTESKINEANG